MISPSDNETRTGETNGSSVTASKNLPTTMTTTIALDDAAAQEKEFCLVWLDKEHDGQNGKKHNNEESEIERIEKELSKVINHIEKFSDAEECQEWLKVSSFNLQVIIIISGNVAKKIIPEIQALKQILAIYICWHNKKVNKWAKNEGYDKVQGVFSDYDDLCTNFTAEQKTREERYQQPVKLQFFFTDNTSNQDKSLTELNGDFLWFQLMIDILLRLTYTETDRKDFFNFLKQQPYGQHSKTKIDAFEEGYMSADAIWWYARESFAYRYLNKALRIQHKNTLVYYGFFIKDLYEHMKKIFNEQKGHLKSNQLYRGQLMSKEELNQIKSAVGQYVAFHSFVSTTTKRDIAKGFLDRSNAHARVEAETNNEIYDLEKVLFTINISSNIDNIKPYVNIGELRENPMQKIDKEILFMPGSIFKIQEVIPTKEEGGWKVTLCLANENHFELRKLSDFIKNERYKDNDRISLGDLLRDVGEVELARQCYQRQLNETVDKKSEVAACCYSALATIAQENKNFAEALTNYKEAFNLFQSQQSNVNVANSYGSLAHVYFQMKDYKKSLECDLEALSLILKIYGRDTLEAANSLFNIANTYFEQGERKEALNFWKHALEIRQKYLPENHSQIAATMGNIGCVYESLGRCCFELALSYYEMGLQIKLKSLPSSHRGIHLSRERIGNVRDQLNKSRIVIYTGQ